MKFYEALFKGKNLTTEQIVDKWYQLGFLNFLETEDLKIYIALLYEKVQEVLLDRLTSEMDDKGECNVDTIAFPAVRRVVSDIYKRRSYRGMEYVIEIMETLEVPKFIMELERAQKILMPAMKETLKNIDWEAHMVDAITIDYGAGLVKKFEEEK